MSYHQRAAAKQRTNVSVNADLLAQARALGINVSAALEEKLTDLIRTEREKQFLSENRDAIMDANAFVARHGVFSDGRRRF